MLDGVCVDTVVSVAANENTHLLGIENAYRSIVPVWKMSYFPPKNYTIGQSTHVGASSFLQICCKNL